MEGAKLEEQEFVIERTTMLVEHAAKKFGISRRTIYYWMESGVLDYKRVGCSKSRRPFVDTLKVLVQVPPKKRKLVSRGLS